ncbi:MAG: FAD binding domain-containing protein [Gammaproteobacteria bacterium]|nr:FAD binding domain-containing protein [Gammaproteobacteria bacterium]MDH3578502.1 FAD binding domain-containing protein [Gammaproteobacteria bacterium]
MGGWKNYHTPGTVEEAIAVLHDYDGSARVIGGGTDLLVETRRGMRRPYEAMVDASRIAGLNTISQTEDGIVIGCGVTHAEIVNDERITRHGQCLAESCSVIGGPQVRNVGTLAGNVAHALPAGDGTIGLLALGGEVEIAGTSGRRWIPAKDTFIGPGKSAIDRHREVLTRLRFKPTLGGEGSAFHRVMRPQGLCLPIISMAARLTMDGGDITAASISMGPVGPVPWFAEPAAEVLIGGPANHEQFEKAVAIVLAKVTLRTSKYRATAKYRSAMIRTYLPLILARAAERAGARL